MTSSPHCSHPLTTEAIMSKTVAYTISFREHPEEGCNVEQCAASAMHDLEHWLDGEGIEAEIAGPEVGE
jgi:hypothetical protein